ncbi:hypothetical protein [Litoreibacter arenae]|uniref:Uncharacterized protein n=1 Tax=Litoreibacter arenae DSM 19593 TaxID=1123360 RepID=S9RRS2_9RHOB|nr:hypothetical protein [Litoreibacter arenae]EPX80745.1 hypothetical protein thalar_00965 [Litoreibacter arenae DSM 19593]
MKYCAALLLALTATSAAAQDTKAWFVLINQGAGRTVVDAEWSQALTQAGVEDQVQTVIDTDFYAIDRTIEKAKSEGDGTVVFMVTGNLGTTDPAKHAEVIKTLTTPNPDAPLLDGSFAMLQSDGCALVRKPLTGREFIHTDTILTINDPQARVDCYAAAITYAMNNLDEFGPRTPFDQQIDVGAAERQTNLPPMAVSSKALIDPSDPNTANGPVRRASNVYKPGEKMDFHANILNVGRFDPGTSKARYEIRLDLEVTRKDGDGKQVMENAYTYTGQSTHRIPVPDDYFSNFVTAGFSLTNPGEYLVELVLTDLSRPDAEGTSVRVPYDVVIAD